MLRKTILFLGYFLIFAAAAVGVVDGTRWIANGTLSLTPIGTALREVGITASGAGFAKLPALPVFASLGVALAVLAIALLRDVGSIHDLQR
jgi:hypothetical protein